MFVRIVSGLVLFLLFYVFLKLDKLYQLFFCYLLILPISWEYSSLSFNKLKEKLVYFLISSFFIVITVKFLLDYIDKDNIYILSLIFISPWVWIMLFLTSNFKFNVLNKIFVNFILSCNFIFSLILLLETNSFNFYILFIVFVVVIYDSMSYFVGCKYGKTKFTKISPNKSVEGFVGGFLGTLIFLFSIFILQKNSFLPLSFSAIDLFLILIIVIFSILGDIYESYLKRQKNLKDSGTFIPGHGGALDRLDSHIFAIPLFTLVVFL